LKQQMAETDRTHHAREDAHRRKAVRGFER